MGSRNWGIELWDRLNDVLVYSNDGVNQMEQLYKLFDGYRKSHADHAKRLRKLLKANTIELDSSLRSNSTQTGGNTSTSGNGGNTTNQTTGYVLNFRSTYTLSQRNILIALQEEATHCTQLANNIESTITTPMAREVERLKRQWREHKDRLNQIRQQFAQQKESFDLSLRRYKQSFKDWTKAQELLTKADNNPNVSQLDLDKYKQNADNRRSLFDRSRGDYATALQMFNRQQWDFYASIIVLWSSTQVAMHENRYHLINSKVSQLKDMNEKMHLTLAEAQSNYFAQAVDVLDSEGDGEHFIDCMKTGRLPPCDIEFLDLEKDVISNNSDSINDLQNQHSKSGTVSTSSCNTPKMSSSNNRSRTSLPNGDSVSVGAGATTATTALPSNNNSNNKVVVESRQSRASQPDNNNGPHRRANSLHRMRMRAREIFTSKNKQSVSNNNDSNNHNPSSSSSNNHHNEVGKNMPTTGQFPFSSSDNNKKNENQSSTSYIGESCVSISSGESNSTTNSATATPSQGQFRQRLPSMNLRSSGEKMLRQFRQTLKSNASIEDLDDTIVIPRKAQLTLSIDAYQRYIENIDREVELTAKHLFGAKKTRDTFDQDSQPYMSAAQNVKMYDTKLVSLATLKEKRLAELTRLIADRDSMEGPNSASTQNTSLPNNNKVPIVKKIDSFSDDDSSSSSSFSSSDEDDSEGSEESSNQNGRVIPGKKSPTKEKSVSLNDLSSSHQQEHVNVEEIPDQEQLQTNGNKTDDDQPDDATLTKQHEKTDENDDVGKENEGNVVYFGSCTAIVEFIPESSNRQAIGMKKGDQFYILGVDSGCGWTYVVSVNSPSLTGFVPTSYLHVRMFPISTTNTNSQEADI